MRWREERQSFQNRVFWGGVYALIAQLAEHIHGKDEVISSILIEGS